MGAFEGTGRSIQEEGEDAFPRPASVIRVKGEDGRPDDGWEVLIAHKSKGSLTVKKESPGGGVLRKEISLAEYAEMNGETSVAEDERAHSGDSSTPEHDITISNLDINVESAEGYLRRASDEEQKKFMQRLSALFSVLAADPSMNNNPERYSLEITDAHTGLAVLSSSKKIEMGVDVLMGDGTPIELIARTISEGIHSPFNGEIPQLEETKEESTSEHPPEPPPVVEPVPEPSMIPESEIASEREAESGQRERSVALDEAREAYVRAHAEYLELNQPTAARSLGIGGDTSAVEAARATYDAALKAASEDERRKFLGVRYSAPSEMPPVARATMNKALFEKFVVEEERKMAALKVAAMPEQKQGWYKKAWTAYARLPRWKKIAISTVVSTGIAAGAGAGVGILARRALSPLISATAGLATTAGFGLYDKTLGRKKTKEYEVDALLRERAGDVVERLEDMKLQYGDILERQAGREKKRMYLRMAVAALAGASASSLAASHLPGIETAGHHALGGIRPEADHIPPHSAGAPVVPNMIEHAPVEVHKGDSLWEIATKELEKENGFDKLNDAQKTWMISATVDRAIQHKGAIGFSNPDVIAIGTKLDLSSVLKGSDVHSLVERASHLTAAQQENILAHNHEIVAWLHAHPHEQLTGQRVNEIIGGQSHAHSGSGVESGMVRHGTTTPEAAPAPQHAAPGAIAEQIHTLPLNSENGQQILGHINAAESIPPAQMRQLLLITAERVGDHHPLTINMADMAAVHRQMRDYLVSYPKAQELGFRSYDHWTRVRDVPVGKFMDETAISPRPEALQSALRHSFWHRGAIVHEMRNGALRSVPLEERHMSLGMAFRGRSDLVRAASENTTVGDFLATHHAVISGRPMGSLRPRK